MPDFLLRLLVGALIIFIVSKVVEILKLQPKAAEIINVITIIGCVIYIVAGSFLKL